ncbi:MAG: SufE family protein [Bdellovibrionales bacterium]|nr:SufE family protein [Bdellovibrionales bacterium]
MEIERRKKELVEELTEISDPQDKLIYLIELGQEHPSLEDEYKVDLFKVEGCQAQLWLYPSSENGVCKFRVDSDSKIVKGIAALLAEFYSGLRPSEIMSLNPDFLAELGITQHLSFNRRNALSRIYSRIRNYAEQCEPS